jgi:hypothetical protein
LTFAEIERETDDLSGIKAVGILLLISNDNFPQQGAGMDPSIPSIYIYDERPARGGGVYSNLSYFHIEILLLWLSKFCQRISGSPKMDIHSASTPLSESHSERLQKPMIQPIQASFHYTTIRNGANKNNPKVSTYLLIGWK